MEFTIDPPGYRSDPLARIDVVFRGNTADAIKVTMMGAFYDDADAVFKSRDNMQMPAGPFGEGGTRRRNATRLASRDFPFDDPTVSPDGGAFFYPGVGGSVMRVESNFDTSGVDILDLGFNAAVGFTAPDQFGEEPWLWDTSLAPGTVFP
jgi:hypothetical protein